MKFSEKTLVEDYVIQKLEEKGWKSVPPDGLERDSYDEPLLVSNLVRALKKLNADKGPGEDEIKQVLNELKFKSGMEGIKKILNFFKTGVPVKFEKERVVKYVRLFDYDNMENNEFIVTRQAVYQSGDKGIRTDVMLYVNGIPLVNIECKNPASFSENWHDAYLQIKDYEKLIPELYKYVQIGIAAEQRARYFPIVPWQEEVKIHLWREDGTDDPIDAIIEMLSKKTLLDIIRYYLFFREERGEETKVIARYMQYRASEKIVRRVLDNLEGREDKNKGLIWHWQGSGKTLTMIFAANKLHHQKELENPSIFFIIDRIDLEDQHFIEFNALDVVKPEIIGSISDLKNVIRHDEGRGKRGVMMALVHKFRPDELNALQKELEEQSKKRETILTRKNVIAFIDEGHRTQYGILAGQMKKVLQNAFFFAFTGTPISKKYQDTYKEFSYPPDEPYLDRYFITDSIKDGFTKKIVYQPRLEKFHLKKDVLETFLEKEFEELDEDVREVVEDRVRKKLNSMNAYLQNPERIDMIARDVAEHFKENLDGRFKAMVVAVNREACVLYKSALDKYLPKEYSEVVMTYKSREKERIRGYIKEARARYGGRDMDDIKKDSIEKFKEEEVPKILIVTNMLLAGFDAPVLQTMYLDKPLREHHILQAIARTNRPFKDAKEAGLIIDYVGILKEVTKAFEAYGKDYQGAIFDIDALRTEFVDLINKILEPFKDIEEDRYDRGTLLKAVEVLTTGEEDSKTFIENYRTLRKLFELLASDESKIDLLPEYRWISAVYAYYLKMVMREQPSYENLARKYFKKTLKYVHESTEISDLEKDLPVVEFDDDFLENLEERVKTKEEKAANIVFTLNRFVLVERHKNPVYESLTEKVERILNLWKGKTKDFEKICRDGVEVFRGFTELTRRQKELGFNDWEYSLLLTLENEEKIKKGLERPELVKDVEELSEIIDDEFLFPGWTTQPVARKKVERALRKFIRRYVRRYGMTLDELNSLYQKLVENVRDYGKSS